MLPLDGDTFLCSGGLCPVELCIVAPETIIHCDVEPVKPENVEMMDEVGYDDMDSSPSKKKELRMVPINTARRYVGRVRLFRQVLRTLHHPEVIQRSKQRLQVRWTQTNYRSVPNASSGPVSDPFPGASARPVPGHLSQVTRAPH
eukprot:864061_1